MALSAKPLVFTSAVVVNTTTAVVAAQAPPDNCHTILLYATSNAIFGTEPAGEGALTLGSNATFLPAGLALTLSLGTLAERGDMSTPGKALVFAGTGGTTPTIYITYICNLGP